MSLHNDPRATYVSIASKKFAESGYHGTSLAALAKEAGVTKQALLHFFGTKDALYAEVLAELSSRMCEVIDSAKSEKPADVLREHFTRKNFITKPSSDDAKLIVRALLDSHENARIWPMKPYLDRLTELVQMTPGGKKMSYEDTISWIFQMIGGMQYMAISKTAIAGMFGKKTSESVVDGLEKLILKTIDHHTAD